MVAEVEVKAVEAVEAVEAEEVVAFSVRTPSRPLRSSP